MTLDMRQARILIVDDVKENLDVLGELLSDYNRIFALNGEQALKRAVGSSPDLILLDVMMPGMDGFETCRRLKSNEQTRDIPIIFITSLDDDEDESKGLDIGAVDYIVKPFSPSVVRSRVHTHIKLKHAQDALENQNVILEERVIKRTGELRDTLRQLKESNLETILRLAKASEYKDDDTGAHLVRMSHYSAVLARKIGFSDEEIEEIQSAAPMHDLGKIGIPDRILLKPGPLTDDEWTTMRGHSKMGADILKDSSSKLISIGQTVAISHHEKWDGTGYPGRLRGEEIPLVGRIVAIADVFDALTSKRPYKKPFSLEKSYGIIKEGRGRHFDPDVVDAFFDSEGDILRIKERYQDSGMSHLFSLKTD